MKNGLIYVKRNVILLSCSLDHEKLTNSIKSHLNMFSSFGCFFFSRSFYFIHPTNDFTILSLFVFLFASLSIYHRVRVYFVFSLKKTFFSYFIQDPFV